MKFFLYIILIAYSLQLTAHSQKREQLITHWRGDKKTYSFTENGDWAAHKLSFAVKTGRAITDDRLIWKRNTLAGGDSSQIYANYSSTSGKTTFAITILQVDAEDLPGTDYVWDLEATDTSDTTDVTTLFDGVFRIKPDTQTRFDGVNIPPAGTRFHWAPLDSSDKEPGIAIFRNSDNSVDYINFEELGDSIGTDTGDIAGIVNDTADVLRSEWKDDISDSLAQNLVTEAYNLFSVTKQYPIEEEIILFRQKEGVRIDSVLVVVSGSSPSLNFNLFHGTLASPDSLFSTYQTADQTSGETFSVNDFDEDTILVNEWVQISFNTISGVSSITAVFYWTPLSASTFVPVRTSPSEYVDSYNYNNEWIDFFYGGKNLYDYEDSSRVSTFQDAGFFDLQPGFEFDTTFYHSKFHQAITIKTVGDTAIPKFVHYITEINYIFRFYGDPFASASEKLNATMGFWIDREELNGNGLIMRFGNGSTATLTATNLATINYESNNSSTGATVFIVDEIDGDFSHITYLAYDWLVAGGSSLPSSVIPYLALSIYNSSPSDTVASLTFYNPTLIYNKNLDPYHNYESLAEKHNSRWIGKTILYIGDSQYNEGYFAREFARLTGARLIDAHEGGHRMAYGASWFYDWTKRSDAIEWTDVDVYFLPISSNDNGGGELNQNAIDSVEYFYPVYGDHADTVTAKLARFAALSTGAKTEIFEYQETYSAYLRSILTTYPDAKIIIGSVPISCGSGSMTMDTTETGQGIWAPGYSADERRAALYTIAQTKRSETIEIKDWFQLYFADCMNEVGLTYENFINYASDGVHWYPEIKRRLAYSAFQELQKVR